MAKAGFPPLVLENLPQVPAGKVKRYSGSDTSYQELAKWTVGKGKAGKLVEVSMATDNYDKTLWRFEAGGEMVLEDVILPTTLTMQFTDLRLSEEAAVTLSVKSADGTAIVADGSIVGKELG